MASKKEDWDDFDDLSEFDDLDNFNFEAKEPEPGEPAYRKMLIGKYLGAVGGGVLSGIKKAAESELSESADVVSEIGDWGSDLSDTWDTLKDATEEVIEQGRKTVKQLMPSLRKLMPQRIYGKLEDYLSDVNLDEEKRESPEKAQERMENESIQSVLGEVFNEQLAEDKRENIDEKIEETKKSAIETKRFAAEFKTLTSIDQRIYQLSTFMAGPYTNYLKKSLEVSYRQYYTQKGILQLHKATFKMVEAKLEELKLNTSLPDTNKFESTKKRLPKKMATQNIIGNFRENLIERIKAAAIERLQTAKEGLGSIGDFLGMGADFGMTKEFTWHDVLSGALKMGVGSVANRALTGIFNQNEQARNFIELGAKRLRTNLYSALAGPIADKLRKGPGWISWLGDMIPKGSSWKDTKVIDDFLARRNNAAQFDELTKRSIVEIIPAHLERIGDMAETLRNALAPEQPLAQKTFDFDTGSIVDANVVKKKMLENYVGTQSSNQQANSQNLGFLVSARSENFHGNDNIAVNNIRRFDLLPITPEATLQTMSAADRKRAEETNKANAEHNRQVAREAREMGITDIAAHNSKVAQYEQNIADDLRQINEHRGGLIMFMNRLIHSPDSIWLDDTMFRKIFTKLDQVREQLVKNYATSGYPAGCTQDWPFSNTNVDDWRGEFVFNDRGGAVASALRDVFRWDPVEGVWTIRLLRRSLFKRVTDKNGKVTYVANKATIHTLQDHVHQMQNTDDAQQAQFATELYQSLGMTRLLHNSGILNGQNVNAPMLDAARDVDVEATRAAAQNDPHSRSRLTENRGLPDEINLDIPELKRKIPLGPEIELYGGSKNKVNMPQWLMGHADLVNGLADKAVEEWGRGISSFVNTADVIVSSVKDFKNKVNKTPYYYVVSLQRLTCVNIQARLVYGKFNNATKKVDLSPDRAMTVNVTLDTPQYNARYGTKMTDNEYQDIAKKLKQQVNGAVYFPKDFKAESYPDNVKGSFVGFMRPDNQFATDSAEHTFNGSNGTILDTALVGNALIRSPAAAGTPIPAPAPSGPSVRDTVIRSREMAEIHSTELDRTVQLLALIQKQTKNIETLVAEQVGRAVGGLRETDMNLYYSQMHNHGTDPATRDQLINNLTTQYNGNRSRPSRMSASAFRAMLDTMGGPSVEQQVETILSSINRGFFNPEDVFIGLDENNNIVYRIADKVFVQKLRDIGFKRPEYAGKLTVDIPAARAMAMLGVGSYVKLDREAMISDALTVAKSLQGKDPLAPESIKVLTTELSTLKQRERQAQQREGKRKRARKRRERALNTLSTKGTEFQQSIEAARTQAEQIDQTEAQQQLPPPEPANAAGEQTAATGDSPLDTDEPEKFALEKAASWLYNTLSSGIDSAEELYDQVAALPEDMAKGVIKLYNDNKEHFNKEFKALGGVATSALTDLRDWLDDKKDAGIAKAKSLGQYLKERYNQKKQQLEESWKNSRAKEALHNVGDNVKAYLTQANWGKVAGDYLTQFRESMEDYQKKMSEKFFPKLDELVENTKSIPAAAWYSFKSSPMAIEFFDKYYSPLKGWLHEKVENVKKWAMGGPGAMTGIRGFLRNMMSKPSAYRLKALGWSRQNFDVTKLKPNDLIHIGWFPTFCGGLKLDPTKELYDLFEAALKDYRKLLDLARAGNKGDDNLAIAMDIMARTNDPANGSYAALAKYLMDHQIKSEDVENTLKAYYRLTEIHGPSAEDPDSMKHALRKRWLKLKRYVSQIEFHGLAGVVAKGVKLGYKIIKHLPLRVLLNAAKKIAMKGMKTVTKLGHKLIQHVKHSRTLFKLLDVIGIRLPERAKVITKAPWWEEYCKQFDLDPEDTALIALLDNAANAFARFKQFGSAINSEQHYHFWDCADKVRQQLIYENKMEDQPLTSEEGQRQHADVCQMCVLYWRGRDNGPAVMTDMMQRQLDRIDREINDTLTSNTAKPPRGTGLVRLLLGKRASSIYQKLMGDSDLKLSSVADGPTADDLKDDDLVTIPGTAEEVSLQSGNSQQSPTPNNNQSPTAPTPQTGGLLTRLRTSITGLFKRQVRRDKEDIVKTEPDGTQIIYKKNKVVIIDKNNAITVRDYHEGEKEKLFPENNKSNALIVRQIKIKERFESLKQQYPDESDDKLMRRAREEVIEESGSNRLLSMVLGEKRAHRLREMRVNTKRKAAEFARKSLDKLKGGVSKVSSMGMSALRGAGHLAGKVLSPIGHAATSGLGMLGNAVGMLPGMSHIVGTGALLNPVTAGALALAAGGLATYKGIKGSTVAQTAKDLGIKEDEVTARDRWARGIGQGLTFGLGGKWATKVSDELIENSALSALPRLFDAAKHAAGEDVPVTDKDLNWARRKLKERIDAGDRQAELDLQQFETYVKNGARYEAMAIVRGGVGSNLLKTVATVKPGLGLAIYGAKKFGQWAGQAYGITDTTKSKVASLRKELVQRAAKDKTFNKVLQEYDEKVKLGALADAVAFGEQALRSPFMQKLTNVIGFVINKDKLGGTDKPLTAEEIKQVIYRYDVRIKKGDKLAATSKKKFLDAVQQQDWETARVISGKVHDSWAMSITKSVLRATGIGALVSGMFSNEDKPLDKTQIEQRVKKFEEQIKYWSKRDPAQAERYKQELEKFQDAVNSGDWPTANRLAKIDTRSEVAKGLSWLGNSVISTVDSNRPMTKNEIDKFRRKIANMLKRAGEKGDEAGARQLKNKLEQFNDAVMNEKWPTARRLSSTEDTGAVYLGAKIATDLLIGLNSSPMTPAEIERYRSKIKQRIDNLQQSKLENKDTLILRLNKDLTKFEDAVASEDWPAARRISKQDKNGLLTTWFKATWNVTKDWLFGSNDTPMTAKELTGFRDKMQADIARCEKRDPERATMLRNKLAKFEDAVLSSNWKRARSIANMPNSGVFGMATNALIGAAKGAYAWLWSGDANPMTAKELETARAKLNELVQQGNPRAKERLEAFEQAVSESRWSRARNIANVHQLGMLKRLGQGLGNLWDSAFSTTINKTPMTEEEIERYRYRFNMEIASGNKVARSKAVLFEKFVKQGKWADARAAADLNYIKKSWTSKLGTFLGQITGLVEVPTPKRGLHDFSLKSMGVDATLGALVGRLRGYNNYREFESALEHALEKRGTDPDTINKIIQAMRDTYCDGASFMSPILSNAKYYHKLLDKGERNISKEDEAKIRKETAAQLTEQRVSRRAEMKYNIKKALSSVYIKFGNSGKEKNLALKSLVNFAKYYTFKEMFNGVKEALLSYNDAHGVYGTTDAAEWAIDIILSNLEDEFEPEETDDEELEDTWLDDQDFYHAHVEQYYRDLTATSDNPKAERKRLLEAAGVIESGTVTLESGTRVPSPPKKISQCANHTYPKLIEAIKEDIESDFGTTLGFGGDKARYDWAMGTLAQFRIGIDDGSRKGKPLYDKANTFWEFIGLMFNRIAYLAKQMGLTKGKKVSKFMEEHRRRNWIVSKIDSTVPPGGDNKEKWRIAFTIAGCFCGCLMDDRKLLPEDPEVADLCANSEKYFKALVSGAGVDVNGTTSGGASTDTRTVEEIKKESEAKADTMTSAEFKNLSKKQQELPESVDYLKQTSATSAIARNAIAVVAGEKLRVADLINPERYANLAEAKADLLQSLQQRGLSAKAAEDALSKWISLVTGGKTKLESDADWWHKNFQKPDKPKSAAAQAAAEPEARQALPAPASKAAGSSAVTSTNTDEGNDEEDDTDKYIKEGLELLKTDAKLQQQLQEITKQPANVARANLIYLLKNAIFRVMKQNHKDDFLDADDFNMEMDSVETALKSERYAPVLKQLLSGKTQDITASPSDKPKSAAAQAAAEPEAKQALPASESTAKTEKTAKQAGKTLANNSIGARYLEAALQDPELKKELETIAQPDYKYDRNADAIQAVKKAANRAIGQKTKNSAIATIHRKATMSYIDRQHFSFVGLCTKLGVAIPDSVAATGAGGLDATGSGSTATASAAAEPEAKQALPAPASKAAGTSATATTNSDKDSDTDKYIKEGLELLKTDAKLQQQLQEITKQPANVARANLIYLLKNAIFRIMKQNHANDFVDSDDLREELGFVEAALKSERYAPVLKQLLSGKTQDVTASPSDKPPTSEAKQALPAPSASAEPSASGTNQTFVTPQAVMANGKIIKSGNNMGTTMTPRLHQFIKQWLKKAALETKQVEQISKVMTIVPEGADPKVYWQDNFSNRLKRLIMENNRGELKFGEMSTICAYLESDQAPKYREVLAQIKNDTAKEQKAEAQAAAMASTAPAAGNPEATQVLPKSTTESAASTAPKQKTSGMRVTKENREILDEAVRIITTDPEYESYRKDTGKAKAANIRFMLFDIIGKLVHDKYKDRSFIWRNQKAEFIKMLVLGGAYPIDIDKICKGILPSDISASAAVKAAPRPKHPPVAEERSNPYEQQKEEFMKQAQNAATSDTANGLTMTEQQQLQQFMNEMNQNPNMTQEQTDRLLRQKYPELWAKMHPQAAAGLQQGMEQNNAALKESPQEYAASFDRYGKRIAFRRGNHDNVRLPTKPGGTIIHTHPQGTGPSLADMQAATQTQQAKLVTIPMNNNSELLSPLNSLDQTNAVQLATLQQIAQGLQLLINVMQQHNQSLDQHVIRTAETTFQSAVQMSQQLTNLNQQRLRKAEYQAGPVAVNKK